MADDRLRFILDFVAQTAGLKTAQDLAEQLGTELGDTEDAGKKMAAALKAAADKAQQELGDTIKIADRLADALGPELTARVNVDEIAGKMQRVGMTVADVEANVDSFRASLSQMADTADQAKARMGDLDDGARRVGDRIDDAGRASHSFAGNVVGDMAGAAAGFGPLSEGIGQVVEGALEGGTAFRNLALAAGGMGVVAFAMTKFTEQRRKAAEVKAFNAKEVEDFTKALRDGDSAVQAIVNHFQEAGKIEVKLNGLVGEMFSGDVVDDMARAGVTIEMLATAAAGGAEGIADLATSMENAGVPIDASAKVMLAAMQTAENMTAAEKVAANWAKISGTAFAAAAIKHRSLASALEAVSRQWDVLRGKLDDEAATDAAAEAMEGLATSLAGIDQQVREGAISWEEGERQKREALRETKSAVYDLIENVGKMPPSVASRIDVLLDEGRYEDALRKLQLLSSIVDRLRGDGVEWFGSNVDRGSVTAGRGAPMVDGERPIEVTTTLVINDRAVQSITATQEAQRRGSR